MLKKLEEHKVLTVTLCLLSFFIIVPVILNQIKGPSPGGNGKPEKRSTLPEKLAPPLLNRENLTGSVWVVTVKQFAVNVALEPDGKATASSDNILVRQLAKAQVGSETLSGSWNVEGHKLTVKTKLKDKEHSTDLVISGDKIYSKDGVPIVRKK